MRTIEEHCLYRREEVLEERRSQKRRGPRSEEVLEERRSQKRRGLGREEVLEIVSKMERHTITSYYTAGQLKRVAEYNPKEQLDGYFCLWNPRGFKTIETTYRNGLIHGEYRLFSNDEQIVQVSHLSDGKLVSPAELRGPSD